MVSYQEARAAKFMTASTTTVMGVPLDGSQDAEQASSLGRMPIMWCVCVTEPCDCPGTIIWVDGADIREQAESERRNRSGDQLHEYKVDPDATILVESVVRTTAASLGLANRRASLNPSKHLPSRGDCGCSGGAQSRSNRASGSYYAGQDCGGGTLYDVYVEADGLSTVFYYVAVGSC